MLSVRVNNIYRIKPIMTFEITMFVLECLAKVKLDFKSNPVDLNMNYYTNCYQHDSFIVKTPSGTNVIVACTFFLFQNVAQKHFRI